MSERIYMQSDEMLGSTVELRLVAGSVAQATERFAGLWQKIAEFERRFSRFKKESEISALNAGAGKRVLITPEFKRQLEAARYYAELTEGVFNPFILPGLQRAGYVHSMVTKGGESPDHSTRKVVSHELLEIGGTWARIPQDTALDLGGIGKGYLADELGAYLDRYRNDHCLSLGGDMRIGGREPDGPWTIDVQSAAHEEGNIATYSGTAPYGIATSGVVRTKEGRTQQHLIDPRTGLPTEGPYRLCTVVADDTTAADVFASCMLIEGASLAHKLFTAGRVRAVLLQGDKMEPLVLGGGFTLATSHAETA